MSGRLLRGIGANVYGQAVTVLVQIGTIPVLLHAWGPPAFGRWTALVAWTTLLGLADGGMMIAAGNAATMAVGRGDLSRAKTLLHGLGRFVFRIATMAAGLLAVAALLPGGGWLDWSDRLALGALGFAALVGLPLGTAELALRADGRYARGMVLSSSVRLGESLAVMTVALSGGAMPGAAVAVLAVRLAGWAVMAQTARRHVPWLAQGLADRADRTTKPLTPLIRPAVAALLVPAALAVGLQGSTIAASLVLPAEAVAVFVTARTLTRGLVQAIGLVTHALMPEMARATGRGDVHRARLLVRRNLLAGMALLGPAWLVLVTIGPAMMVRWTGQTLRPDPLVFGLLATAALAHGCWLSAANLLLAVNRQSEFAPAALVVAVGGCVLAALLGHACGLIGVAAASLAGELAMVAVVLPPQIATALRSAPAPELATIP